MKKMSAMRRNNEDGRNGTEKDEEIEEKMKKTIMAGGEEALCEWREMVWR